MKQFVLTIAFALSAQVALAHGDHAPKIAKCSKECTKEQVEASIPGALDIQVQSGKIDASWTSAKVEKVELKSFSKGSEWVATIFDEKAKDTSKQRLYVFITKKGYLNGSNFTGN